MRKHLSSNWINILGILIGYFCIFLFLALYQLYTGVRGFTIETVFLETIGGSFVYSFGYLINDLIPFLIYIFLLFVVDYSLFELLKGKENLTKRMNIEIIIFSVLFIVYAINEEGYNLLILPIAFIASQWIRKKKLRKVEE
jgi:hypothetical protein